MSDPTAAPAIRAHEAAMAASHAYSQAGRRSATPGPVLDHLREVARLLSHEAARQTLLLLGPAGSSISRYPADVVRHTLDALVAAGCGDAPAQARSHHIDAVRALEDS